MYNIFIATCNFLEKFAQSYVTSNEKSAYLFMSKFRFSKKATKFEKNLPLFFTLVTKVQQTKMLVTCQCIFA